MDEFERIRSLLSPLTNQRPGAFGLTDDAATLTVEPGRELVTCADAMVEGVHFLPEMAPERLAAKLLRVNVSDLAAMGAKPDSYLLTLGLRPDVGEDWLRAFAAGLAEDQARWGLDLLGGDSTSTTGPVWANITANGSIATGQAIRRSGAKAGDQIYVTGTVGDGALGLRAARGELSGLGETAVQYLVDRYEAPTPRCGVGQALVGVASAAIDLSDGLPSDLGHIARFSDVAAKVFADQIPLSAAASAAIEFSQNLKKVALTGGDDYELIFTAAPHHADRIAAIADREQVAITMIGVMEAGNGDCHFAAGGEPVELGSGWRHF